MKKYLNLILVATFVAMSLTLTSCGKDTDKDKDEPEAPTDEIVGTWLCTEAMYEAMEVNQYLRFYANGKFVEIDVIPDGVLGLPNTGETHIIIGTWKRNKNQIHLEGDEPQMNPLDATISKLTKTELCLNFVTVSIPWEFHYKKVADSEADKYLH